MASSSDDSMAPTSLRKLELLNEQPRLSADLSYDRGSSLSYTIDSFSSYSGQYKPEHIMHDTPHDKDARWAGLMNGMSPSDVPKEGEDALSGASTSRTTLDHLTAWCPESSASQKFFTAASCHNCSGLAAASSCFDSENGTAQALNAQWIMIKLDRLALVDGITFGKHAKGHPCNIKHVQVLYGPSKNHMIHGFTVALKNDPVYETFTLQPATPGKPLPCRYIKILPLTSYGNHYNRTLWYIGVQGRTHEPEVEAAWHHLAIAKEKKTLSLTLKHLRQQGLYDEFNVLRQRLATPPMNLHFEHPLATELHSSLVMQGDYDKAEACLDEATAQGLLDHVLCLTQPQFRWQCLDPGPAEPDNPSADLDGCVPGERSGHQMVFVPSHDDKPAALYLYGGYDGDCELGDFWRYDIDPEGNGGRWFQIHSGIDDDPESYPGTRSCHAMCYDNVTGDIYLLGRFLDDETVDDEAEMISSAPPEDTIDNSLWAFHTRGPKTDRWQCVQQDVKRHGGPKNLHDLQMVVDEAGRGLWVFGGRNIRGASSPHEESWSGLYKYNLDRQSWTLLRNDTSLNFGPKNNLLSRHGHCMMFDPVGRKLVIYGGQREDRSLSDLWTYGVDNKELTLVCDNALQERASDGFFTHRAIYDPVRREVRFHGGCGCDCFQICKHETADLVAIFDFKNGSWCRYRQTTDDEVLSDPRYAHQFIYDPEGQTHYLFGGTRGRQRFDEDDERYGDLWSLRIQRMSATSLLQRAKFFLRRQKFIEMCHTMSHVEALTYLQTQVAVLMAADDTVAHDTYRQCMHYLLSVTPGDGSSSPVLLGLQSASGSKSPQPPNKYGSLDIREARTRAFSNLVKLFPEHEREPAETLADLVNL